MTLREFKIIAEGHEEQSRHELERMAWACANLMNCWTKKKIKPADLLPKGKFFKGAAKAPRMSSFEQKMISKKKDMKSFQAMMRGIQADINENNPKIAEEEEEYMGESAVDLSSYSDKYDEDIDVDKELDSEV
jgi:hypothetical protein